MTPATFQEKLEEARRLLLVEDYRQALSRYEKLSRTFPGQAVVWFELGNAASHLGKRDEATRAWQRAMTLQPHNSQLILQIGHQYQCARQPKLAEACFARAAAADPSAINPRISRAVLLEQQHRLCEARAAIEECLSIDPGDDQARYFSAVLDRREEQLCVAERKLRGLIQSEPKHPYVRYACRYELAHILDRTERFDEAMKVLSEAKQLVRALTDTDLLLKAYDQAAESARRFALSQPNDVLQLWAKSFPAEAREAVPQLAFLGGHPRSGTTLLEQVLAAHPGVTALDEPPAFVQAVQPAFAGTVEHSSACLNALRRSYTDRLQDEVGAAATGKLLLDKNPSLTAQLPTALRVSPELRVIIALRDPRDAVLSCYFQNILLNVTNANFLSLERLAKHYGDLMDVWLAVREWRGFSWLETRYEDIVADLESEGRRVTRFLGLDWHTEQHRFYERSRPVYSPTYRDVTRPVYGHSVGRWRAYQKHLEPILSALGSYCRTFGYE
jgi:tetratricopeptide (TPR) repeat protein